MHRLLTASVALATVVSALPAQVEAIDFADRVLPILSAKCFRCHDAAKSKGGLRLDGRAFLERGGDGEDAVLAGDLAGSGIYRRVTLALDDPDFMPQKGDPLTAAETETLRRWIEQGADFGTWVGETLETPRPAKARPADAGPTPFAKRLAELAAGLEPLAPKVLSSASTHGLRFERIAPDLPLLRVSAVGDRRAVDDRSLRSLGPLLGHVAILDLAGTEVTDEGLATLRGADRLLRLDLGRTDVTSRGLTALGKKPRLESIHLVGAERIDAAAIEVLEKFPKLERAYVWRTGIDARALEAASRREGAQRLRLFGAPRLPTAEAPADPRENSSPRRRRR